MNMKHILIALITISSITILLLLSLIFYPVKDYKVLKTYETRSTIQFNTSEVDVDDILLTYTLEFYDEAIKVGIDIDNVPHDFYGVFVDKTPIGYYGMTVTTRNRTFCIISDDLVGYLNKLRLITFHELGHAYGMEHCHFRCIGIMSSSINGANFYGDWELQKKIMFNDLSHEYSIE